MGKKPLHHAVGLMGDVVAEGGAEGDAPPCGEEQEKTGAEAVETHQHEIGMEGRGGQCEQQGMCVNIALCHDHMRRGWGVSQCPSP